MGQGVTKNNYILHMGKSINFRNMCIKSKEIRIVYVITYY